MPLYTWTEHGGMMYSDNLSEEWRLENQPLCRFRQLVDIGVSTQPVTQKGEKFIWNVYGDLPDDGAELAEDQPIPSTKGAIFQNELVVKEFGLSTPYTGKLEALTSHPPRQILNKLLRNNCVKKMDVLSQEQFAATPLKVSAQGGVDAAAIELTTNGVAGSINDTALTLAHVDNITTQMGELDMPAVTADGDYFAIGRPKAFGNIKTELQSVRQYVSEGYGMNVAGEVGRYGGVRFINQTNIAASNWTNNSSDDIFFVAEDAVTEGPVLPEQIRVDQAKYHGRVVEMAWYYLGGFKLTRDRPEHARVLHWDSAS